MPSVPQASDQVLLNAAIEAFGRFGLEGASTRNIAKAAGKPMSAITYHFGGKDGLYLACAEYIGAIMGARMSPVLDSTDALCAPGADQAQARLALILIFERFVDTMVHADTEAFSRFIVREQMEPTDAFAILWGEVMERLLERIAALLVVVSGGALGQSDARVSTLALMGQVVAFRVARAGVMRLTGWTALGPAETAQIHRAVQRHLAALLDHLAAGIA